MITSLRRGSAGVAAALFAVLVVASLAVVPTPAAAEPESSVTDYLGCLQGQRSGDLLILFDTSGSLDRNDSANRRADAAKALVAELASYAAQNSIRLDAAMAGFGWHYQREGDWADLGTEAGRTAMDAAITTVSQSPEAAFESDFWSALDGAQRDLSTKTGADVPRCQALLWFTDGEFRLAQRTNQRQKRNYGEFKPYLPGRSLTSAKNVAAAQQRGIDDICADGGPADRLRSGNVTIWGIGLSPANQSDKPDLELVERVAEGTDGTSSCGGLQSPPGRYFPVDNADQLVREIWELAHPGAQHLQRFVLDDAVTGVAIAADRPGSKGLRIAGPTGIGSVDIPYQEQGTGESRFGTSGVTARWRWDAADSVTVSISRGPADWTGIWSILDQDGQPADPNGLLVSFQSDLRPSWPTANRLIAGETVPVDLGLTRGSGAPMTAAGIPGEVSLSAELVAPGGARVPIADGVTKADLNEKQSVDLATVPGGAGTARLTLIYTTRSIDGLATTLAPSVVIAPVTIEPPRDRGTVTGPLSFGEVRGPADSSATVTVTGPSCVWLAADRTALVGPPEAGGFTVSTPHSTVESCLRVDDGATAQLPVQLTTALGANGNLSGQVFFQLAPEDDPTNPVLVSVETNGTLTNPIDPGTAVPAFLVAFLLGLGIPIGLLYLVKWRGARIPGRPLEAILVPVSVAGGEVRHGGQPLSSHALPAPRAVNLLRKGSRSTTAAGVDLRTRVGAHPFGPGFVEATLPRHVGGSATWATPSGKTGAARLPLAVHNTWAVFQDPTGDPAAAQVLLLRGFDLDDAAFDALVADARTSIPDLLAGLRPSGGSTPGVGGRSAEGASGTPAFGLGGGEGEPGSGFGLSAPDGADRAVRPPSEQPPARPPSAPAPPAPPGAGGGTDWTTQSFGDFGLGSSDTPGDTTGERKAP